MTHEASTILSEYLRIDTTNPPGNESQAAEFLGNILEREGVSFKTYEAQPGRVSLRAMIPGSGQQDPLVLLSHSDVVPANPSEWSFDPFGGVLQDGFIHGRGALDMKGIGIMQLMALLHVHRQKIRPNRDLIFLVVADEETGGTQGAKYLLDHYPGDFQPGLVLNEGAFGIAGMFGDADLHMIATAEKGPCWIQLSCSGPPGHGSMPHGQNALETLVKAAHKILGAQGTWSISPVVAEYFRKMSARWDFLQPYAQDGNPATLEKILRETGLANSPQISAMVQNTMSINVLQAGERPNVIPSRAEAHVDVRLLPGHDPETFVASIRDLVKDFSVEVETTTVFPASESPMDHPDYESLEKTLQTQFPTAVVAPSLTVGTTDSRFFREKGFRAYGFCPATIPLDDIKTIHGIDEKISEENLVQGSDVYTDAVLSLCQD